MRRETEVEEEDGSVLEAEQTNLSLSPHLCEGVVLRLFAESEHLSRDSHRHVSSSSPQTESSHRQRP
ncbi:hypothetical protein CgunFtcFv8_012821 [Champsocephalus gunnari]|uniref:Uncharacterized protein n=1 Tax=Champsocephalus gunnari TaxID=52237 RepID=A0AAN8DY81_CHAGU|nr:hypothetical protein CgunFtcFv8_012821 [Champsocephalus gunnari]